MTEIDPNTPVIIGVGQSIDRLGADDYEARSAVDLAAAAAARAIDDTGADADAVRTAIDTVAAIRQFDDSTPGARAPLGRSDNVPRSVAARLGADPAHAILEVGGGQSPQHLVTELAASIAAGTRRVALAVGAEAISTVRALARADDRPDFTEHVDGGLDDRGYGLEGIVTMELAKHGLAAAAPQYALLEHARRARLGCSRAAYARSMGELFASFTAVAAANPYAAAPVSRSADELVTVTDANRMIADPYPRLLVARDQVNQGAAVLLASVAAARELGVPEEQWVFLHGHADLRERPLMDRPDLSRSPAAVAAAALALETAGVGLDEVDTWDFYSCFPIAVTAVAVDGLGLEPDDPRGLTVTGGLPYFGGPGNDYAMHAIAETVQRMRRRPGAVGFVGANGGILGKYSAAVYSTTPCAWRPGRSAHVQAELDAAAPAVPQTSRANGWAVIETCTIDHHRDGRRRGIVIGRLEATGERFVALGLEDDDRILDLLAGEEPIGMRVWALSTGPGNRVTVSPERAEELRPSRPPVLAERYEHVRVERDGHLLVVTIDRPAARNALFPAANEELGAVFDAFFADRDLWVAVITGAGGTFCAGNDLVHTASGKPTYLPAQGFAGLTSRRDMSKPVIAAVEGYALGGGFETALACHLIVAGETARFGLTEVKVGLVAGAGGVVRLPRAIPEKIATELILTGRQVDAAEAHRLGLVNRVVPAGAALTAAKEIAAEITAVSPTSVRTSLRLMAQTRAIPDVVDAVTLRTSVIDELMVSHDALEGMTAFARKRPPRWRNR
ncbi:acetyl-CoA acetyltransferase [Microbacterium sp. GXF7504]